VLQNLVLSGYSKHGRFVNLVKNYTAFIVIKNIFQTFRKKQLRACRV